MAEIIPKYINAALVKHSHNEFWVDLIGMFPPIPKEGETLGTDITLQATLEGRFVMTPLHMKLFVQALSNNVQIFEQKYGSIVIPTNTPPIPTNYTVN